MPEIEPRSRAPWGRGRTFRKIAIALIGVSVFALFLLWGYLQLTFLYGVKQLAAAIKGATESDPHWRWEDITSEAPLDPNGANSLHALNQSIDSLGNWRPTSLRASGGRWIYDQDYPPNRRWDEQSLLVLRSELEQHNDVMESIATLKDAQIGLFAFCVAPDWTQLPVPLDDRTVEAILKDEEEGRSHPSDRPDRPKPPRELSALVTECVALLMIDAERLAHDGATGAAIDRIAAMFRAASGLRGDYLYGSQWQRLQCRKNAVASIERLLAKNQLSADQCRGLRILLAAEQQENLLLAAVRGERAILDHFFRFVEKDRKTLAGWLSVGIGSAPTGFVSRVAATLYSYQVPEDHAMALRWCNQAVAVSRHPFWEQSLGFEQLEAELRTAKANSRRFRLFLTMASRLNELFRDSACDQAYLRAAETAAAVEGFRLANDRWPTSLVEIVPAFIPSVPVDPFNGLPLKYSQHEDGVVIYSVGPNLTDDGGATVRSCCDDCDPGFRLYSLEKRSLNPL